MYVLIETNEYPEGTIYTSTERAPLEEIALALYEEDAYEWFNIFQQDRYTIQNGTDLYKMAHEYAMRDNKDYIFIKETIVLD